MILLRDEKGRIAPHLDLPENELYKLYWGGGLGQTKIAKRKGCSQHAIWRRMKRYNMLRRHPTQRGEIRKRANLEQSEELSFILGFRYSDGSLSRVPREGHYRFIMDSKDKEFLTKANQCLLKIVGREYPVWEMGNGTFRTSISNKSLFDFLSSPFNERHKAVVESFPSAFLGAFFDGEGCVSRRGVHSVGVGAVNKNLKLLQYIKDLLQRRFGIRSWISARTEKMIYELGITRKKHCQVFAQKIGFTIRRKREKLRKLLGD